MKKNPKRVLTLLLALMLIFSLAVPAYASSAMEEGGEPAAEESAAPVAEDASEKEEDTQASEPAEEAKKPAEEPAEENAAAAVQALIDALPAAEEINAENAEAVKAQLEAIDQAKAALTDEDLDGLNAEKYLAAAEALGSVQEAQALVDTVAKIGDTPYTTLGNAVAAVPNDGTQTVITLTKDASGGGVKVQPGQNIIFDFGGFTYTVGAPTVGSVGTETNGFQLLSGSTVTMRNGTVAASDYPNLGILIQNYCNLTLENVTLTAKDASQCSYVVSNNHGNVQITGNSSIIAAPGNTAFDVYYWPANGYVDGVSVTVNTTGTIDGKIEYGSDGSAAGVADVADKASLKIQGGTVNGEISLGKVGSDGKTGIAISGGSFSADVSAYAIDGNTAIKGEDGRFTIGADPAKAVAEVNGKGYTTVQEAVNAANGGEVKLLNDTEEDVEITGTVTLNLNGKTLTNDVQDTLTVRNGASLTVTGEGNVYNKTNGKAAVFNEGTVTLDGGTYDRTAETGSSADVSGNNTWYTICNHGDMTINSANVRNTGKFSSMIENGYQNYKSGNPRTGYIAGQNKANPSLTINNGSFDGGLNTVKNDDGGVVTINNGTFTNTAQAAVLNWNQATINGGDFQVSTNYAVVLNGKDTGNTSDGGEVLNKGELTITGGSFTAPAGVAPIGRMNGNPDMSGVNVSGGTFSAEVPEEYCAPDFAPKKNADGTYGVHQHVYGAEWKSDSTNHWHECTVCGEKADEQAHTPDTKWTVNETNHWHVCSVCGEKLGEAAHVSDGGKVTTPAEEFKDGVKTYSCTDCGTVLKTEAIPATHVHTEGAAWKSDATSHWHECSSSACDAKLKLAAHDFKWIIDKEPTYENTGVKHERCAVCGYEKPAVTIPAGKTPQTGDESSILLYVLGLTLATGGLTATVLYGKKRKQN